MKGMYLHCVILTVYVLEKDKCNYMTPVIMCTEWSILNLFFALIHIIFPDLHYHAVF